MTAEEGSDMFIIGELDIFIIEMNEKKKELEKEIDLLNMVKNIKDKVNKMNLSDEKKQQLNEIDTSLIDHIAETEFMLAIVNEIIKLRTKMSAEYYCESIAKELGDCLIAKKGEKNEQ